MITVLGSFKEDLAPVTKEFIVDLLIAHESFVQVGYFAPQSWIDFLNPICHLHILATYDQKPHGCFTTLSKRRDRYSLFASANIVIVNGRVSAKSETATELRRVFQIGYANVYQAVGDTLVKCHSMDDVYYRV